MLWQLEGLPDEGIVVVVTLHGRRCRCIRTCMLSVVEASFVMKAGLHFQCHAVCQRLPYIGD